MGRWHRWTKSIWLRLLSVTMLIVLGRMIRLWAMVRVLTRMLLECMLYMVLENRMRELMILRDLQELLIGLC